jgi:1-acyl-sn-glycerol-3-phosphate acyltransferase
VSFSPDERDPVTGRAAGRGRLARASHFARILGRTYTHYRLARGRPHRDAMAPDVRSWAQRMLRGFGVSLERTGATLMAEPGLLVSNHTSYLDILAWSAVAPAASFLSKDGVRLPPVIGSAARLLGTVFVDRESAPSRKAALYAVARKVTEERRQVVVFPEGTTTHHGRDWRRTTLSIARRQGFRVQPACITYSHPELTAYVEKPLPQHLWDVLGHGGIKARLHLFEPLEIVDDKADTARVQELVQSWFRAHHGAPTRDGLPTRPAGV